jgi:hypothetical protein
MTTEITIYQITKSQIVYLHVQIVMQLKHVALGRILPRMHKLNVYVDMQKIWLATSDY